MMCIEVLWKEINTTITAGYSSFFAIKTSFLLTSFSLDLKHLDVVSSLEILKFHKWMFLAHSLVPLFCIISWTHCSVYHKVYFFFRPLNLLGACMIICQFNPTWSIHHLYKSWGRNCHFFILLDKSSNFRPLYF